MRKRLAVSSFALLLALVGTGATRAGALLVTDPFYFQLNTQACNGTYAPSTYEIGYGANAITQNPVCSFPEVTGIRRTPYSPIVRRYNYVWIWNASTAKWMYMPPYDSLGNLRYQQSQQVSCPDQCFLGATGDVWWSLSPPWAEVPRNSCVLMESALMWQFASGPDWHYLYNMYCSGQFVESIVDGVVEA